MIAQPKVDPAPAAAAAGSTHLAWRVLHDLPHRTRFGLVAPALRRISAAVVERTALAVPGVRSARFAPETGSLLVEHDGGGATRRELERALGRLGADDVVPRPGEELRPAAAAPEDPLTSVVLSLVSAALPPAPMMALALVRSLAKAAAPPR
jgi:hypothetical protein